MKTTVFIADDHEMLVDGLKILLNSEKDMEVIGSCSRGSDTAQQVRECKPDIILMDISMPGLNGIEATQHILSFSPNIKIIIISVEGSKSFIQNAFRAGACGYVLKASAGEEVIEAIRRVREGGKYISHHIADVILDDLTVEVNGKNISNLDKLSAREHEILLYIVEGKNSRTIAKTLDITTSTVDTYRSRLMKKLDIENIPDLVKFAVKKGLITVE